MEVFSTVDSPRIVRTVRGNGPRSSFRSRSAKSKDAQLNIFRGGCELPKREKLKPQSAEGRKLIFNSQKSFFTDSSREGAAKVYQVSMFNIKREDGKQLESRCSAHNFYVCFWLFSLLLLVDKFSDDGARNET